MIQVRLLIQLILILAIQLNPKSLNHQSKGEPTIEIDLLGVIGDSWDYCDFKSVKEKCNLLTANDELIFNINSFGGSIVDGIAIFNLIRSVSAQMRLKNSNFQSTAKIMGFALSAASVIAMGCDNICMQQSTIMMIHNVSTGCYGSKGDMLRCATDLEKFDQQVCKIYCNRTGMKETEVCNLMNAETYFSPEEALAAKLCDTIDDSCKKNNCLPFEKGTYLNFMQSLQNRKPAKKTGTPNLDQAVKMLGELNCQ